MPTAWGYLRFSHTDQANGLSEAFQRDRIESYVKNDMFMYPGIVPGEIFADRAVSAYRTKLFQRKAGSELYRAAKPGDHIIFFSLDRGFRNVGDACNSLDYWQKHGIIPHFVTQRLDAGNPVGAAMLKMVSVFAEMQSAITSERIKESLRIASLQRPIHIPPGYVWIKEGERKSQGYLAHDLERRSLMQEAHYRHRVENLSLEQISLSFQMLEAKIRGIKYSDSAFHRFHGRAKIEKWIKMEDRYQAEGPMTFLKKVLWQRSPWIREIKGRVLLPLRYPLMPGMPYIEAPMSILPSRKSLGLPPLFQKGGDGSQVAMLDSLAETTSPNS